MKRVASVATAVFLTFSIVVVLFRLRALVVLVVGAVVLAAAARPIVDAFTRRGIPRGLAIVGTYLGALGIFSMSLVLLGGGALDEAGPASRRLVTTYQQTVDRWSHGSRLQKSLAAGLPELRPLAETAKALKPGEVAQTALVATGVALEVVLSLVVVVVLSVYWAVHGAHMTRLSSSLIPIQHRVWIRRLASDVETAVGFQVLGEGFKSLLVMGILALAFHALGLPFPTLSAVLIGLLRIVPLAGTGLAAVVGLLAGAAADPYRMLWAGGVAVAVVMTVERLLPRVLALRAYNPVFVITTVLVLSQLYGWVGLLLAAPIAAALEIALSSVLSMRREGQGEVPSDLDALTERLARARVTAEGAPRPHHTSTALLQRLERLLAETRRLAKDNARTNAA